MRRWPPRNAFLLLAIAVFLAVVGVTQGATGFSISPGSLAAGTAGSAYSQTISVSGPSASYTVKVTQGSLPSGLGLASNGTLSGTPATAGTYQFTVSAFDSSGAYAGYRDYYSYNGGTLTINAASSGGSTPSTLTINPSPLPAATAGSAYSQTITVSGPTPPYTVRVTQGSFPGGLSLSASGTLAGTPATAGSYAFTVSAFTSAGSYVGYRDYNFTVGSGATGGGSSGGSSTAYFADDFEGGIKAPWVMSGASNQFALVSGSTGNGVQLTNYSSSAGPNSSSQMSALWFSSNTALAHAYQGQNTWYRFKLYLPSSYQPTTGQWNWLAEWHDDNTTMNSCGSNAVSVALGVYTDYPVVNNAYGKNPRLALRLAGGSCSSPQQQSIQLPSNSLQRGHWYDLTFHFVWSNSSSAGLAEWWVDGTRQASTSFPTLYTRPDGSTSINSFGFYNYRLNANWAASIVYDSMRIGPTQASVS